MKGIQEFLMDHRQILLKKYKKNEKDIKRIEELLYFIDPAVNHSKLAQVIDDILKMKEIWWGESKYQRNVIKDYTTEGKTAVFLKITIDGIETLRDPVKERI